MITKETKDFIVKDFDFFNNITTDAILNLNSQLENAIITALSLKGFDFENKPDLEKFIKERCRCEDNIDLKERTYFVDEKPFFWHSYNSNAEIKKVFLERETKFSVNYGIYKNL